jgi:hydrogenase maturation protease
MTSGQPKILIAGIGNIFHGDDAFGVELAQRLLRRPQPDGVKVGDFGIRGFDLAYALMDGPEVTILLDATPRGGEPGTLYTIEIDPTAIPASETPEASMEAHGMNPMRVLRMVKTMGEKLNRIVLIGCEPLTLGPEEGALGLSDIVMDAVERAVDLVESLTLEIISELKSHQEMMECQKLK